VSLTSAIRDPDNRIRAFFGEHFPNTDMVMEEWRSKLEGVSTLHPPGLVHHSTIGTAIDYRIRFYFGVNTQYVAHHGISLLVAGQQARSRDKETPRWEAQTSDFLRGLRSQLRKAPPIGRRLERRDEDDLCRYCYILALFEQLYRAGLQIRSPLHSLATDARLDQLLALAPQAAIDDIRQLSWKFYDRHRDLLMHDAVLNPTFAGSSMIGGADADLIVDRCLIELKTTINPRRFADRSWPWQLLGYVLLDFGDRYIISGVGVYLSRQGALIRWPLREFMASLSGDRMLSLSKTRQEFRRLLETIAGRGGLAIDT
jgi:hypothetical protein